MSKDQKIKLSKAQITSIVSRKPPENSEEYTPAKMREVLDKSGLCSESLAILCSTTTAPTIRHLIGNYDEEVNPRVDTIEDVGSALKTHWLINPGHSVFARFDSAQLSLIVSAMNAKKINIANGSGITRQALHQIMNGSSVAMFNTAKRIGDYLKITFYTDVKSINNVK